MAVYGNQTSEIVELNQVFLKEVDEGLSSEKKYLSSKYFYDEKGDELFVKIMNMPEYYLTNSEFEILSKQSKEIVDSLGLDKTTYFECYELGAGDGTKTIEFLKELQPFKFNYLPIDISPYAIDTIESNMAETLPWLKVNGQVGDYFERLNSLKSNHPKVILFLGSNLGNYPDEQATDFISKISAVMNKGDQLILGVDLKKEREVVLPAYDDTNGFTSEFNLNLLDRINHELDADFDRDAFEHAPYYDEKEGIAWSYIKSLKDQQVKIKPLKKVYHFKKGEMIHTEISRKYNDEILKNVIRETGLEIKSSFLDQKKYFCDYVLIKK